MTPDSKLSLLALLKYEKMQSAAYIRTFPNILDNPPHIYEVLDLLLEELDHLFEHWRLKLEDRCFIRTFLSLLAHLPNLLENRRAIALELSNGTIENTIC